MTMTQPRPSASTSSSSKLGEADVTVAVLDANQIRAVELPSGWHNIQNCEFTQFAIGKAHSPISPGKLYPALRYQTEDGNEVFTPLGQILSYSSEPVSVGQSQRR